jgi:type I restriction enzyme S subunit
MREMKDSNYGYLGIVPQSWKVDKIKYHLKALGMRNPGNAQVLSVYREYGVIPKDSRDDNHNVTSEDTSNYRYVRKGDFVINKMKAWQGSMAVSRYTGIVSPAYYVYKFTDDALNRGYFHYLLRSKLYAAEFARISGGIRVGQWDLSAYNFENTMLLIPPLEEQGKIATFLDSQCSEIDAISADIQKEIEILEQYKRSLVFEAISKGINGEKTANASSDIWKEIPQSWKLVDIKYLFEIVKRIAGREGYNILSVTQKGLKVKDISGNQGQIAENYSGYQFVFPSDYVMNHMDLLTGWIDCSDQFGVTSPDYRVFRLRDKTQNDTEYYKYVMQCCYMCRIFYSLGQGVSTLGRWRLQTSAFMNFKVPVPPLHEQKEIARYLNDKCKEIELSIEQKRKQLELLSAYKKSLIYEYVTGKKEVI